VVPTRVARLIWGIPDKAIVPRWVAWFGKEERGMLFTLGKVSSGDYGEESLVSRLLLAMVFNEYAVVNKEGRAFVAFACRCLGLDVSAQDMSRATATVEFQTDRCGSGGDRTTVDSLLTVEPEWIWGIEAKYFDVLKRHQIEREARAIHRLAEHMGYRRSGLLFLVPEQQLGTVIYSDSEVRGCLAGLMQEGTTAVRVSSWEIVNEILSDTTPVLREHLAAFWKSRNENQMYAAKVGLRARVPNCEEWMRFFLGQMPVPLDLPRLADGGASSFSRFGQASAEMAEVFQGRCGVLADEIVCRARRFGFEPKVQKSGYVNLSRLGRAYLQIHPYAGGVALVVREAAGKLPPSTYLAEVPYQSLPGYRGSNRPWLDGHGKYTSRPAAAVLVPVALEKSPGHVGWQEVDAVFRYAQTK